MEIKTFVFLDSETTGLPFQESNRTRMTELCFTAVQSSHISLGVFPRIQSKVSFCFNPRKLINADATRVSGLTNDLLEHQPEFNAAAYGMIRDFLDMHQKPICFVAHNGNRFDYPILQAEIHRTGNLLSEEILCVDSLLAFRQLHYQEQESVKENIEAEAAEETPIEFQDGFDELLCNLVDDLEKTHKDLSKPLTVEEIQKRNESTPQKQIINISNLTAFNNAGCSSSAASVKRKLPLGAPSFRLGDLYTRLTSKKPTDAHKAEYDVNMLIECAATLGQRFVDWSNFNAKRFCDIPMMTPGRKIGV